MEPAWDQSVETLFHVEGGAQETQQELFQWCQLIITDGNPLYQVQKLVSQLEHVLAQGQEVQPGNVLTQFIYLVLCSM